jgi:hypothetical protein
MIFNYSTCAVKTDDKYVLKGVFIYFYRCTVHFEDSLIITYLQMY